MYMHRFMLKFFEDGSLFGVRYRVFVFGNWISQWRRVVWIIFKMSLISILFKVKLRSHGLLIFGSFFDLILHFHLHWLRAHFHVRSSSSFVWWYFVAWDAHSLAYFEGSSDRAEAWTYRDHVIIETDIISVRLNFSFTTKFTKVILHRIWLRPSRGVEFKLCLRLVDPLLFLFFEFFHHLKGSDAVSVDLLHLLLQLFVQLSFFGKVLVVFQLVLLHFRIHSYHLLFILVLFLL